MVVESKMMSPEIILPDSKSTTTDQDNGNVDRSNDNIDFTNGDVDRTNGNDAGDSSGGEEIENVHRSLCETSTCVCPFQSNKRVVIRVAYFQFAYFC